MARSTSDTGPDGPQGLRRLHGGRHGISPDLVAHSQRERLLAGIAAAVAEHGYAATTITSITDAASVSRRTFYENFEGKEECFLAAYEALDDYVETLMASVAAEETTWPERVAATLTAVLEFLGSRPNFAHLYLVEAPAVGPGATDLRERTFRRFVELLAPGRELAGERAPVEGLEEAQVGGILALAGRQVIAGRAAGLAEQAPATVEFALAPYLGPERAHALANSGESGG